MASSELWLVSAPGEKNANDAWDKLNRCTGNLSVNNKFNIPDLKVRNFFLIFEGFLLNLGKFKENK